MLPFRYYRFVIIAVMLSVTARNTYAQSGTLNDSISAVLNSKISDSDFHVDRLNEMIFKQWEMGLTNEELVYQAKQVLEIARSSGYKKGEADALTNLVRLHLNQYQLSIALENAMDAITIYEGLGDVEKIGYNQMQMGVIYYVNQDYAKSQQFYNLAIKSLDSVGDSERVSTLYYLSGLNYSNLKSFELARENFRIALARVTQLKNSNRLSEILTGMAELFIEMAEADSAVAVLEQLHTLKPEDQLDYGLCKVYIIESKIYLLKKDKEKSLASAKRALEVAEIVDASKLKIEAYKAMSDATAANNSFKDAFDWRNKEIALDDSLFNEKNTQRISQLEAAFKIQKTENQLSILERENRIRELLLKGSIAITALVLILSFVLYNRFKIKRDANKELSDAYNKLNATQEQLVHHKKMASLGQFASGIAHEIQNPLNFVNNFAEMNSELISDLKEDSGNSSAEALLKEISVNNDKIFLHGKRAQAIVKNLQDHSNLKGMNFQLVNVNSLLDDTIDQTYSAFQNTYNDFECVIVRDFNRALPQVEILPVQVAKVLQNILSNAMYAVKEKSKSQITGYVPELIVRTDEINDNVVIIIRDNGMGMDPVTKERAFEPFFTNKPNSTGLGLSLSYDIITAHQGKISVESEPGDFTEFIIEIPEGSQSLA